MTDATRTIDRYLPDARRGDRRAFAELVKATQTTVTSIALAIVRDVQLSEDVAQEAYLRVWRKLHELRNPASFLPWLRQVTRNLARDHLRRARSRPGDQAHSDSEAALAGLLDEQASAEAEVMADQDVQALQAAFDALPADARELLTLYYREGRSVDQLAALLGISPAGVRQRLARARRRLRDGIEPALERAVVRSSPGATFTALVSVLLASAGPPPGAAAASAALGTKGALKVAAFSGLGLLLGAAGGIAGIVLGLRPYVRAPFDERERLALLRQQRLGVLFVLLAIGGFAGVSLLPGWLPAVLVYVLFIGALTWHSRIALPRILARRLAAERATDPDAARRQARQQRMGLAGLIVGGLAGLAGLLMGLVAGGRLG